MPLEGLFGGEFSATPRTHAGSVQAERFRIEQGRTAYLFVAFQGEWVGEGSAAKSAGIRCQFYADSQVQVAFEVELFAEDALAVRAGEGLRVGMVHRAEDGVADEAFVGVEGAAAFGAGLGGESVGVSGLSLESGTFAHVPL